MYYFQERIEGVALERIQVTQGLLRVKKEEELQELPVPGSGLNSISAVTANSISTTKDTEVIQKNVFLGNRRASPPPEDWKPLDKCYFCLDGKLPHDDQAPLVSPHVKKSIHSIPSLKGSSALNSFLKIHEGTSNTFSLSKPIGDKSPYLLIANLAFFLELLGNLESNYPI